MKLSSKLLAIIIALSLSLSLVSPALAANNHAANGAYPVNTNEIVVEERENYTLILRGEDMSNGDSRFSMVENGQVISCSYINHSEGTIIYTQYENGMEVYSDEQTVRHISHTQSAQFQPADGNSLHNVVPIDPIGGGATYTLVGRVGYAHYVQGMLMCINYINWAYYAQTIPISTCDLNGYYRDLTDFAVSIMGFLGLISTNGALEIANAAMTVLGLSGSAGGFFFPEYRVQSVESKVIWRASAGTSYQYYDGSRHVVTHPNGQTQVVIEGDYYPTNAIANHNSSLAFAPYISFYPGSERQEIVSWP